MDSTCVGPRAICQLSFHTPVWLDSITTEKLTWSRSTFFRPSIEFCCLSGSFRLYHEFHDSPTNEQNDGVLSPAFVTAGVPRGFIPASIYFVYQWSPYISFQPTSLSCRWRYFPLLSFTFCCFPSLYQHRSESYCSQRITCFRCKTSLFLCLYQTSVSVLCWLLSFRFLWGISLILQLNFWLDFFSLHQNIFIAMFIHIACLYLFFWRFISWWAESWLSTQCRAHSYIHPPTFIQSSNVSGVWLLRSCVAPSFVYCSFLFWSVSAFQSSFWRSPYPWLSLFFVGLGAKYPSRVLVPRCWTLFESSCIPRTLKLWNTFPSSICGTA